MKRTLWGFVAAVGVGAGLSACGLEEERGQGELLELAQEVDVCQGENTLPGGGKFVSESDWNNVGAADQPGYTGIDASKPADKGLIDAEKKAADAMNGGGCIYGAHGGDPDSCGGKTSVQSLPHDTSQSIFHAEYHTECLGKPLFLSVCFGGKAGTPPYVSIGSAISQNFGVPADKIVSCTGPVSPGNPMKCYGSLVDGNGNPVGNQQVGDLKFEQVRGDPPADALIRCDPNAPCPTCDPDAGTDGGCTGPSCSTDGGVSSDAGDPDYDAGGPYEEDAGSPDSDAGDPYYDAGGPYEEDAGSPDYDAGGPYYEEDAGGPYNPYDAGW